MAKIKALRAAGAALGLTAKQAKQLKNLKPAQIKSLLTPKPATRGPLQSTLIGARNILGGGLGISALAVPAGLSLYGAFNEGQTLDATLKRPKVGGEYDIGLLGRAYGLTQDDLETEAAKRLIKGNDNISEAISKGIITQDDVVGKSEVRSSADIGAPLLASRQEEAAKAPGGYYDQKALLEESRKDQKDLLGTQLSMADQANRRQDALLRYQAEENFALRRDQMQEGIRAREDQKGLLEMQLLQSKDKFDRELAYTREKDAADRKNDLVKSLSALGMAFVL